jgi:L-asparaginase II
MRRIIIAPMSITNNEARPAIKALVEVTRGALAESRHYGIIAVIDGDGRTITSLGEINTRTYYRSAAKPFQAIPIITSGAAAHYELTTAELAVINGSHSGEAIHLELVRKILARGGLDPSALQCGAHMPFDEAAARELRARGETPTALHNNCSGKHAGMLLLARHLGESIDNYLEPSHPIQLKIRAALAEFAGVNEDAIGISIDGCSAPVFALSLAEMARSYARLIAGDLQSTLRAAANQIIEAFITSPEMIGGTKVRLDTDLMRIARGALISKVGAEGVQLLGVLPCPRYPRGFGVAIKIEDGDVRRARDPVVIETLRQLGVLDEVQLASLRDYARATIYNHRRIEVGEVRTCFQL